MKILMVGGTGLISTAVSDLLLQRGHDLMLLNRGEHSALGLEGASVVTGDINDEPLVHDVIDGETFDAVVDWIAFTPDQVQRDIRLFRDKTAQYVFISSASAYQRPAKSYLITENTPLANPFWQYSRNKIECERLLMREHETNGFPVTIVRPSLTYGNTQIPYVINSWAKPWSLIERIKSGKRIIVPGDGTSLWVITHNTDFAKGFVGLLGTSRTIGEAFHITSDEVLTWDDVIKQIGDVVGIDPELTHISSEFITAFMPELLGGLTGDKTTSVVFDNSKLRSVVPDYRPTMTFRDGIARTYEFFLARPELQTIDGEFEASLDKVIDAHDAGMRMAKEQ